MVLLTMKCYAAKIFSKNNSMCGDMKRYTQDRSLNEKKRSADYVKCATICVRKNNA